MEKMVSLDDLKKINGIGKKTIERIEKKFFLNKDTNDNIPKKDFIPKKIDDHEIYLGDCIEVMDYLINNNLKVDTIITDPPYGTTKCKWDNIIPFDEMWDKIKKIKKENTPIILFASQPFTSKLITSNIDSFKYNIIWEKEKPTNFFQLKRRLGNITEDIVVFYDKQTTFNPQMVKFKGKKVINKPKGKHNSILTGKNKEVFAYEDNGYRYPTNIIKMNRVKLREYIHPTQKPLGLLEYLIKTFSNEGDIVLDFTMGSGTTGVACKNLNRRFIGIEINKDYFDIALKRLSE